MKTVLFSVLAQAAFAQVVPDTLIRTILSEVSAENAYDYTRALAARVRYPNSASFFEAAEFVASEARACGLQNVRIERFPAKGPMWDPVEGELDLLEPEPRRLADFRDTPVLLAHGSREGDITAEVVDVGQGTAGADYKGKDIRGKVVLATGGPSEVWRAMGDRGAVGILSAERYAFFGRLTAADATVWGDAPSSALAMMISPNQADELRNFLRESKKVRVRMHVGVRRSEPGAIGMVMGEIPGTVKDQDVVLVAHLDHQKTGANDNASGSGALLEVLAALKRLQASGKIAPPRRTLRFWWSTEIRSEMEYFKKHPEEAGKILLAVNLDQAGGDKHAENHFVVIYGPDWLPSYADDLIYDLAEHVKDSYGPAEHEPSPLLIAPNGSHQSFQPVYWDYAPLSDHIAFEAREVGVPSISVAVPSLHVIHTSQDTIDRIDPTWLKRSTMMALAPALFAANAGPPGGSVEPLLEMVFRRARLRLAQAPDVKRQLEIEEKRLDSVRALDPAINTEPHKKKLRALAAVL